MKSPLTSNNLKSPHVVKDMKSPSPNYFGFVVGDDSIPVDSGSARYSRQNWNETTKSLSRPDNEREFELFRRQSEKNVGFSLNSLPQARTDSIDASQTAHSPTSPTSSTFHDGRGQEETKGKSARSNPSENPFFAGVDRHDSPGPMSPRHSVADSREARLSLPAHEIQASLQHIKMPRSDTLPPHSSKEIHAMVAPQEVASAIEQHEDRTIILDLRVFPQYAVSRVRGALNLCIPTTLLKRPAFTVQKLADTFTSDADKNNFNRWKTAQFIIIYDATSSQAKEAITSFTVLKKFVTEGWKGSGFVVKGGFAGLSKLTPGIIDSSNKANLHPSGPAATGAPVGQAKLPVAGGCQMPATKNAANPFFGNIRQNMDLLDGVGQMPIKKPKGISESEEKAFPSWLRRAASMSNEGKDVSNKFLNIEKTEQKRMQKALSGTVSYGTPGPRQTNEYQVAGIEKGSKNRYNNIFPYEHSRVRLQGVSSSGCDYVNASFVKASYSNRKYIATQAPVPQTFDDFWRVIWEQDARIIVMLTAESEGGQVKSHAYWKSGEYGSIKVHQNSERRVLLTSKSDIKSTSQQRPSAPRRLTTSGATPSVEKKFNFQPADIKTTPKQPEEEPAVIVRHFTIAHKASSSMREITQLQYTQWPDFGAPASPLAILKLIEIVNKFQRSASSPSSATAPHEPANDRSRPIIVHCSAGCGRTGTFCTIDSVIDMLKRQRLERDYSDDEMDVDSKDDWVDRDDIDLVAKAVEDFRGQRLSMVQNLRQFVLCYESVLQWLHDENQR